jgi:hypothetical protein
MLFEEPRLRCTEAESRVGERQQERMARKSAVGALGQGWLTCVGALVVVELDIVSLGDAVEHGPLAGPQRGAHLLHCSRSQEKFFNTLFQGHTADLPQNKSDARISTALPGGRQLL